ncbi:hypothetical protein A9Q87_10395 [Flavobacteriales bacterium 34_180_T64]|nr:hypothetical protein A9Q87_10395 [Flavobacteriales bacterium 34_180_T64]
MKKRLLFISCEEAQHICDKTQYEEATFWEKTKLNIRLSWCRITRAYSIKNGKLTDIVNNSNVECLKHNEREDIKEQFQNELNNQNHK